jgi:hypothetical protein
VKRYTLEEAAAILHAKTVQFTCMVHPQMADWFHANMPKDTVKTDFIREILTLGVLAYEETHTVKVPFPDELPKVRGRKAPKKSV